MFPTSEKFLKSETRVVIRIVHAMGNPSSSTEIHYFMCGPDVLNNKPGRLVP